MSSVWDVEYLYQRKVVTRKGVLGIPTISDRVGQALLAMALELMSEIMSDRCSPRRRRGPV